MSDASGSNDSLARIQAAIPHRPPMLLLDEIVEQSEQAIHCRKQFRADEFFVQGHYPGQPIVPGVILCECAAQASAVLLSALVEGQGGVPVLTRIQDARFKRIVRPGDTIDIQATLNDRLANAFYLTAKVTVEGKLAARVDLSCALAETEG
ncbi:MAG: 3-hydroxyacyl-ACP dehydratase FabZ [Planctomycetales bacterium]|nr:3-hydroxyacyl-ACP dehydratase FabZ [Planctomycetales bacterium]